MARKKTYFISTWANATLESGYWACASGKTRAEVVRKNKACEKLKGSNKQHRIWKVVEVKK